MNQGNQQPRHDDLAAMQKQTDAQEKEFRQQQRLEQGDQFNDGYIKKSRDNSADSARSRSRSANERKRNYQQQQQQQQQQQPQQLSQQDYQEKQGEYNQNDRNNRFQNSETTQQQQFAGMNFNASNLQQLNEIKMEQQSNKGDLQQGFRHARRLYIGNIPETINQEYLSEWLYRSLEAAGGLMTLLPSENPIVKCDIDPKGRFAFTELRSVEETTALLQLDGIILWHRQLRIRRPTEYEKFPTGQSQNEKIPKLNFDLFKTVGIVIIPTVVEDGPNKIFLANLPTKMDELMILDELKLRDMGEIKAFHLVKDNQTNQSKGYAFFEFKDHSLTDSCIEALHGMQYAGRTLTCKRSQIGGVGNKQPQGNNRNNNNGGGRQQGQGGMGRQMFGQDIMMDQSMGMQNMMMGIPEGNQYFQTYAQTMGQVGMGGFNGQKGMNQGGYNNNNGNNNNKRRNFNNNNNNNNFGQNYGGNQGNGGNRRYQNGGNQGQGQWDSFDG